MGVEGRYLNKYLPTYICSFRLRITDQYTFVSEKIRIVAAWGKYASFMQLLLTPILGCCVFTCLIPIGIRLGPIFRIQISYSGMDPLYKSKNNEIMQ